MAITAGFRIPFTTAEAYRRGFTPSRLKWLVRTGALQRVERGVYVEGKSAVQPIEKALATLVVTDGVAIGSLAATLYELDSVSLRQPFVAITTECNRRDVRQRRGMVPVVVEGFRCADGAATMLGLAATLADDEWEQALESALRKGLLTVEELAISRNKRVRRVLNRRGFDSPSTGSLLETLTVQLIRKNRELPTPQRQVEVRNVYGDFAGCVDLAWPEHGVFLELDGGQHKDQPQYDATRQTAVVAATGWLVGRFTWDDVVRRPSVTLRRLAQLLDAKNRQ